jgi:hypothetical protein
MFSNSSADTPMEADRKMTQTLDGSIRRECLDHIVIFQERHLAASYPRMSTTTNAPALIFRSTRIVRTRAQSSRPESEEPSRSRKSVACILATNVSPF